MLINIFGDFVSQRQELPYFDEKLLSLIKRADFNVVNFEAPINPNKFEPIAKSGPSIFQSDNVPHFLEENGFNIIMLANNHIMDFGEKAALETIKSFKTSHLIGAGFGDDAFKTVILSTNGINIGIISLTHYEFGTLSDRARISNEFGTAWINDPIVDSLIEKTSNKVDYLIVLPHAGVENITQPLPEWRVRYKHFIDLGADVVIASHPHIIQGSEKYKGKDIFYSIGNFYFPWTGLETVPKTWYNGMFIQLDIDASDIRCNTFFTSFSNGNIVLGSHEGELLFNTSSKLLQNSDEYNKIINKECDDLMELYNELFYYSGYVKIGSKKWLKRCIKILFHRTKVSNTHIINNLRCESHRFAIIHALENYKERNN